MRVVAVLWAVFLFDSAAAQTAIPTRELREEMRIVSNDASLGTSLTSIASAVVLPDGRLLTLHSTEAVIRVFDATGRFVTMFGRKGEGPGEFNRPLGMGLIGDAIWVRDLGKAYKVFGPDLKPIGQVAQPGTGGFYSGLVSTTSSLYRPTADTTSAMPFGIYDKDGKLSRRIALDFERSVHEFQVKDAQLAAMRVATGTPSASADMRNMTSPLGAYTNVALAPGGRELIVLQPWAIWGGKPGQFTIRRIPIATGVQTAPVTVSFIPTKVTASQADSIITRAIGRNTQITDEYRSKVKLAEYHQPYARFDIMNDNRLWLWEPGVEGSVNVVATDGKPVMHVQLPKGLYVLAANATHVWGTLTDADGLPIIVRYRIQ